MSKSWKRRQREAVSGNGPAAKHEFELMVVLADIIEATPSGQRTDAMSALLAKVRDAQAANPEP